MSERGQNGGGLFGPLVGPGEAGERLKRALPEILRRWEAEVRSEVPAALRQSDPVLRDNMPGFLERLADALMEGHPQDLPLETGEAEEHGLQRAGLPGYTLEQVIREYHLLRKVLIDALEARAPLTPDARRLIHAGLDRAIEASASRYLDAAETAFREIEEPYRLLVESAEEHAIFTLDLDGRITTWNFGAERVLGFTAAEAIGRPGAIIFTPEQRARGVPEEEMRTALAHGSATDERWQQRKDGTRFFASGVLTILRNGEPRGFVKVLRDITHRKELEEALRRRTEELEEASRRKDEFLAMLGHELRNPLAPILHAVYLLQAHPAPEQQERAVAVIDRQARHLARIVDDLLDVARITRGTIELRKETLDLGAVVIQAAEAIRPVAVEHGLDLTVRLPEEPVRLQADPTRLTQVISNLLNNSVKFTPPGGSIEVSARREGDQAVVRVRDTGRGIPTDALPRIFDLFSQIEPSLDRSQGGLGLGLTLVRRLVEMHGGRVEAASAGPGAGSEFTVRLPALP